MNLDKINKELKIYINEASSISNSCKNKLLKIFNEEFNLDLDINNYKNIDLSITKDFKVLYRDDLYESKDNIKKLDDVVEKYNSFKEKADKLLIKKEIDFQNKSNMKNISNLIIVICMIIIFIAAIILGINALINGHYFDTLWFVVVIVPWIFPKFKDSLTTRWIQAKNYLKRLFKRVK